MPGFVEDTPSLLAKSHIGLLLSNAYEGLSNSIMEYMAAGIPVIATNTGGNSELITHGKNGFLINRQMQGNTLVPSSQLILW